MDDNLRSPFKKRFEYKKHSSYLSFQLNDVLVIQNIFAFVCRSRQSTGELVEINVSTCENLSLSCLGLKLEPVCGTADSVYYSGNVLLFHIVMFMKTEEFVFCQWKYASVM